MTDATSTELTFLGAELRRAVGPYVPHMPTVAQADALLTDSLEILYGGAAGGGKSDWLLMEALRYADQPGYAAVLFRRTYPQLSLAAGLIERSKEWLAGTGAVYHAEKKRWTFPSGATLTFAHMQREDDKYDHQGAEYQFIGFDELTQFTESQYRYLFSRLRKLETSPLPLRMRAASNPGGEGHEWVKARFVEARAADCAFIPARLADNPHLDRDEYLRSLDLLHPYERKQLLEGDWDVRPPGARFQRHWFEIVTVPPVCTRRVRYWDLAATKPSGANPDPDYSAGCRMGRTADGRFVIFDVQRFRLSPAGVEARLRQQAALDGRDCTIIIEQEPGSSGKLAVRHLVSQLAGFSVSGERPTGDKVTRSNPLASQAEAGNVLLVAGPWVEPFLLELEMFTGADGPHDDQVDAASGALGRLTFAGPSLDDLYPAPEGDDATQPTA